MVGGVNKVHNRHKKVYAWYHPWELVTFLETQQTEKAKLFDKIKETYPNKPNNELNKGIIR